MTESSQVWEKGGVMLVLLSQHENNDWLTLVLADNGHDFVPGRVLSIYISGYGPFWKRVV